ncbi:Tn7 transposase protein TnsA [Syntrophotalea carbinolica DSM 2380]|uniref:Tn7 transposase protein TnsA n=1 Tax=Syntrophotalea carbinolica (strain DSM 2380 / NBRC 103641 / GraBd1) TaxID=338963 RepID=Q3A0E0_SYNC1|nr:heteromeric transposase endonuclease subunit TnsA [Syntrophotalea carbinolica]ABA90167.1 Tn7 transposase protein TnsA [Syntrophotalea carbinolica DSM 2380]
MSDANKPVDPVDRKRLITRGHGSGKEYEPFIQVQELSSTGESIRVPSATVGRVHHLLSGIELSAFLVFDWCTRCIDIREQYPLPIDDSLDICRQLGIRHPQVKGNLKVVTTDLLIDFDDESQLALAVKPASQLSHERTVDKLQIEKTFWEDKGVEWRLFTEREVSDAHRENLNWLRPYLDIATPRAHQLSESDIEDFFIRIREHPCTNVSRLSGRLDDLYQLEPGFHLSVLRYAVAHHYIHVSLDKPFHDWYCKDLQMIESRFSREVGSAS